MKPKTRLLISLFLIASAGFIFFKPIQTRIIDELEWRKARGGNDRSFRDYLLEYPNGRYKNLALEKLDSYLGWEWTNSVAPGPEHRETNRYEIEKRYEIAKFIRKNSDTHWANVAQETLAQMDEAFSKIQVANRVGQHPSFQNVKTIQVLFIASGEKDGCKFFEDYLSARLAEWLWLGGVKYVFGVDEDRDARLTVEVQCKASSVTYGYEAYRAGEQFLRTPREFGRVEGRLGAQIHGVVKLEVPHGPSWTEHFFGIVEPPSSYNWSSFDRTKEINNPPWGEAAKVKGSLLRHLESIFSEALGSNYVSATRASLFALPDRARIGH